MINLSISIKDRKKNAAVIAQKTIKRSANNQVLENDGDLIPIGYLQ